MGQEYIDRYRVLEELGAGGMGRVLRALDEMRGREVAIKLPNNPDALPALRRECEILSQLQHEHIVVVYGSGSPPNHPFYIVMEYVDGETVEQYLRRQGGHLPPREALNIALDIAEALAYAHRLPLRVIHRDIKPANILIRSSDRLIKVTDFGIAAALAEHSGRTVIGTLFYIAPEQAMGKGADERSDLYSLGVMLYEMLTGQRPPQLAAAPATPPSGWFPSMAPETRRRIDRLVLGLLKGDPAQRTPQRASELVEELRALLEGRPSRPIPHPQANPGVQQQAPAGSPPPAARRYAPQQVRRPRPAVPVQAGPRTSLKATWSLWLGLAPVGAFLIGAFLEAAMKPNSSAQQIITFALILIFYAGGSLAVINGYQAAREILQSHGRMTGLGRALGGVTLGALILALAIYASLNRL